MSSSHAKPSTFREPSCAPTRSVFDVYLDDAGAYSLLTAEEEQAQTRALGQLRVDYWRSLLSCPSLLSGALRVVGERGQVEDDAIKRAAACLATLRERPHDEAAAALVQAVDVVAHAVANSDSDRELADEVADALRELQCGRTTMFLGQSPPSASTLLRYNERVQRARRCYSVARNQFICANLRLVVKIAQRYGRSHMPLADRVQEGNLGLMKAVDRFDPNRGVRFSTYAAWWIRHAVTRALVNRARTVRIPAHLHTIFTKARGARRHLRGEFGREPTLDEVALAIEVPLEKVQLAVGAMELRSVALETPFGGHDSPTIAESLQDTGSLDWTAHLDDHRNHALAEVAIDSLAPIEADIVAHRFGLDGSRRMTLQKLGEKYSLSRERIRQLQNRALRKLRRSVDSDPRPTLSFA